MTELLLTTCGAGGAVSARAGTRGICATSMATEAAIAINGRIEVSPPFVSNPPCPSASQCARKRPIIACELERLLRAEHTSFARIDRSKHGKFGARIAIGATG